MAEKSSDRGSGWWLWLALPAAALALYVLSVGPAVLLAKNRGNAAKNTVEQVYAPLVWLHRNTPLRRPLDAYVELWGGK